MGPVGDSVIKLAALIGAATTIGAACVTSYKMLRRIEKLITGIQEDIADLQYERLAQAYDFYTDRGWCPGSKKAQLCNIYRSYKAKGRNHLTSQYEQQILGLPEHPEGGAA